MSQGLIETALLGRDRTRTVRHLLGAVGLFTLVSGLVTLSLLLNVHHHFFLGSTIPLVVLALGVGLATISAYLNDGLLVSVAMVTAPLYGLYVFRSLLESKGGTTGPVEAGSVAISVGLPIALFAFVTGAVAYRARELVG